jgi:hypothetical protein
VYETSLSLLKEQVEQLSGTNRPIYIIGSASSWPTCPVCVCLETRDQGCCAEQCTSQTDSASYSHFYNAVNVIYSRIGQPNTSRGPNLIYRTPSGARYSVSFRRVVNFQDMNTVVKKQFVLSNSVRTYTVNCKML